MSSATVTAPARAVIAADDIPRLPSLAAIEAVTRQRSSSVPSASCRSTFRSGHKRRSTFPNDTVTTLDLLNAFPQPPRSSTSPPAPPRGKLTLFPRSSDENSPPKPEKLASHQHHSSLEHKECGTKTTQIEFLASGALPHTDLVEDLAAIARPTSSVRGEDTTRYRNSGIPIYTPEAASLHSLDNDEAETAEHSPSASPAAVKTSAQSGRTGQSRYFSATSRAPPSRARPATPATVTKPTQRERALANGAHRFSSSHSQVRSTAAGENLVPVTVTSHGKRCSHRQNKETGNIKGKKSVGMGGFDGAIEIEAKGGKKRLCVKCRIRGRLQRMFGRSGRERGGVTMLG